MESTQEASPALELSVDPFLVEALQNPRHRLTILRMELDIQRFLQNVDQQQFEFQHFPTSYLRLAAHRVAQHYGLITMVQDNGMDGALNTILVKKTAESRYPAVRLCDIPAKQSESDKPENIKIVIRPRPTKDFMNASKISGTNQSPLRTVEERKEEYDKARARIFSRMGSPNSCDSSSQPSSCGKTISPRKNVDEISRNSADDLEKNMCVRNGSSSRVAILRDKEKDLSDPDYDRSYDRYVRSFPVIQNFSLAPFSVPKVQLPFVQHDTSYPHLGQMPLAQASLSYRPTATPVMSPYNAVGSIQSLVDAAYMPWPSAAMMHAQSYQQLRHNVFQAPFCQQPLSFDYSQHH